MGKRGGAGAPGLGMTGIKPNLCLSPGVGESISSFLQIHGATKSPFVLDPGPAPTNRSSEGSGMVLQNRAAKERKVEEERMVDTGVDVTKLPKADGQLDGCRRQLFERTEEL